MRGRLSESDLWREIMPMPVRFVPGGDSVRKPRFDLILSPNDGAGEGIRKILGIQFRIAYDSGRRALERDDPDDLHDLRVAMRRGRAALRLCERRLSLKSAARLRSDLFELSCRLGPIRDAQVWDAFLNRPEIRRHGAADADWERYTAASRRASGEATARLRRILRSRAWTGLVERCVRFLRTELPAAGDFAGGFRSVCAENLRRMYRRLMECRADPQMLRPEQFHELRRLCRRARYAAEFLAPVAGRRVEELATRLKKVADVLGDLHDADVQLQQLQKDSAYRLPALDGLLQRRRESAVAAFGGVWDELTERTFRRRILRRLAGLSKRKKRR